jgi:phosphopantothenoylcysteine synthetase/decarboxylase
VLYLIACGARPTAHLVPVIRRLQAQSWDVCVVATPQAVKFMDPPSVHAATGHVVRHGYKQPDEPDALPPADAMLVAPATFNTVNKWVLGISDTLALGLLNEATGQGMPILAVPWVNTALGLHPVFEPNLATLRSWGVRVLHSPRHHPMPAPNTGPASAAMFPWPAVERATEELRRAVTERSTAIP